MMIKTAYANLTFTAFIPLFPCLTSKVTLSFSRILSISPVVCTKMSSPPFDGVMNPKPLVSLKNFTVPSCMVLILKNYCILFYDLNVYCRKTFWRSFFFEGNFISFLYLVRTVILVKEDVVLGTVFCNEAVSFITKEGYDSGLYKLFSFNRSGP